MAVTSLWHIKGSLKDLIDYVENPEKTVSKTDDMNDFYNVFSYVKNPNKTDNETFVSSINCLTPEPEDDTDYPYGYINNPITNADNKWNSYLLNGCTRCGSRTCGAFDYANKTFTSVNCETYDEYEATHCATCGKTEGIQNLNLQLVLRKVFHISHLMEDGQIVITVILPLVILFSLIGTIMETLTMLE